MTIHGTLCIEITKTNTFYLIGPGRCGS